MPGRLSSAIVVPWSHACRGPEWSGPSPSWRSRCSASRRFRGGCRARRSRRHGVRRGRVAGGARGARRDRPRELERDRASAGGGDAGAGAVLRRLAHRSAAASPRGWGAGAPARHRAAADDRARCRRGGRDLRAAERRGGSDPGDRVGADRRRAGAGGRDRAACPGQDPPGAQRRERAQRRHLRAAAVRGRGGGRRRIGDLGGPQRRDAAARGDRLRGRRRAWWAGSWSRRSSSTPAAGT